MTGLVIQFLIIAGIVVIAGTYLAKYADELGEITGMGRSLAGILLLALATSLPELLVGCKAVLIPAEDLAVGDLLGSSLFNLLILAILDLVSRSRGRMLSRTSDTHALSALTGILLTAIVAFFILYEMNWTFLRLGPGAWVLLVAYLYSMRLIYHDQQLQRRQNPDSEETGEMPVENSGKVIFGFILATAVIFIAAPILAEISDELANQSGLGGTIVGTLFVALVTSLPELVTTMTALRMGAVDLAVGNIFGSNAFNMGLLVGIDLCYEGSLLSAVSSTHAITAAMVIIVTAVSLQGMLYRPPKRLWVLEPDAVLMILLVSSALIVVWLMGH